MELLPVKRALLSVTDKSGLVEFARGLQERGVELVSTGGTKRVLADSGLKVVGVSDVTGFPEILDGRVKTLHPRIHAGILADKDAPQHLEVLQELDIKPFDLICVNLYDFAKARELGLEPKAAVEQIDIGGPTLLRAGAKNYHSIVVAPDTASYAPILKDMENNDSAVTLDLRRKLAAKTFAAVSSYDAMIADYLQGSAD